MKKQLTLILFLCAFTVINAQKASSSSIMTIDGVEIPTKEFYNKFFRSYPTASDADKTLDGYLKKFIEYQTLLKEAKDKGLDTTAAFTRAVDAYTQDIVIQYYQDTVALSRLSKEAFERGKHDIRVSHILVELSPYAPAKDSLSAKARIDSVYQRLKAGDDFSALANKIHKTESNGDMGYVTALQLPYEIETVIYNTPVGEYSKPVRSKYGYHIILPTDKRPARGLVELSHIVVYRKVDPAENAASLEDVRKAYSRLKAGEDFELIVMNYTEDASTQTSGGYIGTYGIGELLPEIEEVVFALDKEGDFTKIIATENSWNIIKLIRRIPMDDFSVRKNEIYARVSKDERYSQALRKYMDSKKVLYPVTINEQELLATQKVLSNMGFVGGKFENNLITNADKPLFTIKDSTYNASTFYSALMYSIDDYGQQAELSQIVKEKLDENIATMALVKWAESLPKNDQRVIAEIEEFKNQAAVYTLLSAYTSNKLSVVDMETLMEVYEKNKSRYITPEALKVQMLMCEDKSTADQVSKMLSEGKNHLEISSAINKGIVTRVQGTEFVDTAEQVFGQEEKNVAPGLIKTITEQGKYYVIKVIEIVPSTQMSYDQALPTVRDDYKAQMAKKLPSEIKDKHSVIINPKTLKTLSKELPKEIKKRGY